MSKQIVIVGGGQAAASFAARLRTKDAEAKLIIMGEEPSPPYQRPPLSKKYAVGEMSSDQLLLRASDWYQNSSIEFKAGCHVASLDAVAKTVTTDAGETVSWDQLFLATGSSPRRLPDSIGGNLEGVCLLRNLEDADHFSGFLKRGKRVAIIGGGYIGLEAAAVCATLGLEVTLVEAADRILQRVACKETSDWFRNLHQEKGVTIYEGHGLNQIIADNGRACGIDIDGIGRIDVDFVLVGIGIFPNTELAEQAGLTTDNGIVVNEFCQTSNPDIFAAGDCAVFDYRGHKTRLESVQNAIDQAECAADNLCGESRPYLPYPWFWSDQYDVKLQIAGLNRGFDRIVVREGEREGSVSHFYFSGDRLLAVDAINDPRTYMVCKKVLESGKNITPEQASDTGLQLKSLM